MTRVWRGSYADSSSFLSIQVPNDVFYRTYQTLEAGSGARNERYAQVVSELERRHDITAEDSIRTYCEDLLGAALLELDWLTETDLLLEQLKDHIADGTRRQQRFRRDELATTYLDIARDMLPGTAPAINNDLTEYFTITTSMAYADPEIRGRFPIPELNTGSADTIVDHMQDAYESMHP